MIPFTSQLKKDVDIKIEQIECSEASMITKSLEASRVLAEAFNKLKTNIYWVYYVMSTNIDEDINDLWK